LAKDKEDNFMNSIYFPVLFRRAKLLLPILAIFSSGLFATAQSADKITIRGSNTIGEELAPRLIAEYKKDHPNVTFDLEFKGSGYGIGALMGDYCDIAGSSKPVSKEQLEIAQIRGVQFKEYILGAYTIRTHLGFKELAMANLDYGLNVQLFTNYDGIANGVANDPNGIGYSGLISAQHSGTKAVSIDGVAPSVMTVNGNKYPYARTLRFYTDAVKESATAKDFINFVLSSDGQKVLMQMGYAPKP
jgi:ABC-type phosphate transport system substrate-binding protein